MSFFHRSPSVHSSLSHLNSLDGLRALSILLVIFFHAFFFSQYAFETMPLFAQFSEQLPWYMAWIRRGDFGVDIFFVLSAFLIGSQLFNQQKSGKKLSLKTFYLKRFLRIYPIYLVAIGIFVAAKGWNHNVLGNIFAYNNLYNLKDIVIPWSWSLSVEIQFYLLFPVFLLAVRGAKSAAIAGLALLIGSLAWMSYFYLSHPSLSHNTVMDLLLAGKTEKETSIYYMQYLYVVPPARIASFVFGVAAAHLWVFRGEQLQQIAQQFSKPRKTVIATLLICLWLLMSFDVYQIHNSMSAWQQIAYRANMIAGRMVFSAIIAALILLALASPNHSKLPRFLGHKSLFPVARGSYAMYLFHPPFLMVAYYILFGESKLTELSIPALLALGALGSVLVLSFSWLCYHGVEKWFTYKRLFGNKT